MLFKIKDLYTDEVFLCQKPELEFETKEYIGLTFEIHADFVLVAGVGFFIYDTDEFFRCLQTQENQMKLNAVIGIVQQTPTNSIALFKNLMLSWEKKKSLFR